MPASVLRGTTAGVSARAAAQAGCIPLTAATLMPNTMGIEVLESNFFFRSVPRSLPKNSLSHY